MTKSKHKTAITPTRSENYSEWYQQVIKAADLAQNSPVRGCMVIKPWGYAIWERMQSVLDGMFKATGHENIYCPLLIPLSFFEKEAEHISGFAKECAVVTHHRLVQTDAGLVPAGELEEPLVIRPTSETIIGRMFSGWISSYRDLPVLTNQWANVMRWEMRTRMFLRTSEFLWQEGHTAHATEKEAHKETLQQLDAYAEFAEKYLAMPVIKGEKTKAERFPGAINTYCIEAMMQDKKALQSGTSHLLGQNFSKAFDIKFLDKNGEQKFAWTTSWGVSTRMIGGLIMTHSDDDGLVLPPMIAPVQIVILPFIHDAAHEKDILEYCNKIKLLAEAIMWEGRQVTVKIDNRDISGGEKSWHWIKKGVPLRIEIGKRELEDKKVCLKRRDQPHRDKTFLEDAKLQQHITDTLVEIQNNLFDKANRFLEENTQTVSAKEDLYEFFKNNTGFVRTYISEDADVEKQLKQDLNVSIRCITDAPSNLPGECIFTGKKCEKISVLAKAY